MISSSPQPYEVVASRTADPLGAAAYTATPRETVHSLRVAGWTTQGSKGLSVTQTISLLGRPVEDAYTALVELKCPFAFNSNSAITQW